MTVRGVATPVAHKPAVFTPVELSYVQLFAHPHTPLMGGFSQQVADPEICTLTPVVYPCPQGYGEDRHCPPPHVSAVAQGKP